MAKLIIKDRFAVISNELLYNQDISFKAKGLYAYIQAKPADWDFSAERIALETKDGVDSIRAGLKELEKFGYLFRQKTKNNKGHWEMEYILMINPTNENPSMENPAVENPRLENTPNNTNKEYTNKELQNNTNNKLLCSDLIPLIEIKNFNVALKNFEGNKQYFYLAYRYWELWSLEFPNHRHLKQAKLKEWYDAVRLIIERDEQSIERLVAIYIYLTKCQAKERGYETYLFSQVKSIAALRKNTDSGEYRIDNLASQVNEKLESDDKFNSEVKKAIESFKNKFK